MSDQTKLIAALRDAELALARVRALLGAPQESDPSDALSGRRMLSVLAEVRRRGGRVRTDELLDIGEGFGYRRRGMAGFYQDLLQRDGDQAVLTDAGHERIARLRARYEELGPPPMSSRFWDRAFPVDYKSDPYYLHLIKPKPKTGVPFSAEDAKRDLYREKT